MERLNHNLHVRLQIADLRLRISHLYSVISNLQSALRLNRRRPEWRQFVKNQVHLHGPEYAGPKLVMRSPELHNSANHLVKLRMFVIRNSHCRPTKEETRGGGSSLFSPTCPV
jgi:hypothetical protein